MTAYDSLVTAESPYLYWKLDEASGISYADSSGNGRGGTGANGNPTYRIGGPSASNMPYGVRWAGAQADIRRAQWATTDNFTLECWIKNGTFSDEERIMAIGDATAVDGFGVTTDSARSIFIRINGGAAQRISAVGAIPNDGAWHLIGVQRDATAWKSSVDGGAWNAGVGPTTAPTYSGGPFGVGSAPGSALWAPSLDQTAFAAYQTVQSAAKMLARYTQGILSAGGIPGAGVAGAMEPVPYYYGG